MSPSSLPQQTDAVTRRSSGSLRLAGIGVVRSACVLALGLLSGGAPAASGVPTVYVFPIPGGRVASPVTQITFRGVPAAELGTIQVTGSVSGTHSGMVTAHSDGDGASFL